MPPLPDWLLTRIDAVVGAAEVGRIDRDVRHFPERVRLLRRHALLDGVLVRAGERREHQIADVGMTRMDRQPRGLFHRARHRIDVREIEARDECPANRS